MFWNYWYILETEQLQSKYFLQYVEQLWWFNIFQWCILFYFTQNYFNDPVFGHKKFSKSSTYEWKFFVLCVRMLISRLVELHKKLLTLVLSWEVREWTFSWASVNSLLNFLISCACFSSAEEYKLEAVDTKLIEEPWTVRKNVINFF